MTLDCDAKFEEQLWFGKSHEEFGQVFTRVHKILKIGTFIGSFNTK